jgi:hypothetical protein
MADKLALALKDELGYYPAPIYEWDEILRNIPVLEDVTIQSNNFKKLAFRLYKRFGIDVLGYNKKLSKILLEEVKIDYEQFHLDIEEFQKNSLHAKNHPKDAWQLGDYLEKLIQYVHYLEDKTYWDCLVLSEGFCKHGTHIINHQKKSDSEKRHFLGAMPKVDAFFYLEVSLETAMNRKKNQKGFYQDYSHEDAMKLLKKSKEVNQVHLKYLQENGVTVFVVNNEDLEDSFNFILKKTKEILFKNN